MKNLLKIVLCISLLSSFVMIGMSQSAFAESSTMYKTTGLWLTYPDSDSKLPTSIVQISKHQCDPSKKDADGNPKSDYVTGKIIWICPHGNEKETDVCKNCDGPLKDKPIRGMQIIWNMTQDPNETDRLIGGQILDPQKGTSYHCELTPQQNAQGAKTLKVRGFVGVPLFGRSQVWSSEDATLAKKYGPDWQAKMSTLSEAQREQEFHDLCQTPSQA